PAHQEYRCAHLTKVVDLGLERWVTRVEAQQFTHGRVAAEHEQLLIESVEQPAECGDDEDEPVIAVQLREPGPSVGGGGSGTRRQTFSVHANLGAEGLRVRDEGRGFWYTPRRRQTPAFTHRPSALYDR